MFRLVNSHSVLVPTKKLLSLFDKDKPWRNSILNTLLLTWILGLTYDIFLSGNFRKLFYLFLLLVLISFQWLYTRQQVKFTGLVVDIEKIWGDHIKTTRAGWNLYIKATKRTKITYYITLFPVFGFLTLHVLSIVEYVASSMWHGHTLGFDERLKFLYFRLPAFDGLPSPYYELLMIASILPTITLALKISGIHGLILGLASHLAFLYDSVAMAIDEIKYSTMLTNATSRLNVRKLEVCNKKHLRIYKVAQSLKDTLHYMLLPLYTMSSLLIGLTVMKLAKNYVDGSMIINDIIYIACMLLFQYSFSWHSQKLIDATNNISNALYNTEWYYESLEFKKSILQSMLSANKSAELNILYYEISMKVFCERCVKILSYFSIFNSILRKNQ